MMINKAQNGEGGSKTKHFEMVRKIFCKEDFKNVG